MVSDGQFASAVDFEQVGSARVVYVVAQSRDDGREAGELVDEPLALARKQDHVGALHHRDRVVVVVERVVALVVLLSQNVAEVVKNRGADAESFEVVVPHQDLLCNLVLLVDRVKLVMLSICQSLHRRC